MDDKALVALMFAVLSVHYCAANVLKNNNVYGRPTGSMTKGEFLERIKPVQEYKWDNEKGEKVPVGEMKILNDDEVHSLLVLIRDPYDSFRSGKRPCDFLRIVSYLDYAPYIHCTVSNFKEYNEICRSAKGYPALVNYCYAAIKKQFQRCSEKGISHLFNDKMKFRRVQEQWDSPFLPSDRFDTFKKKSKVDASLPEKDKIKLFMSSLSKVLSGYYKDACKTFTEYTEEDLAFFFFDRDMSKFDYSAIKDPEPEYDTAWRRCEFINELAE